MFLKSIFIKPGKRGINYIPRELSGSEDIHETLRGVLRPGVWTSEMTCQRPDAPGGEETNIGWSPGAKQSRTAGLKQCFRAKELN